MSEQTPKAVVILAAGKGTRMKSRLAKVLHPIGNAPMLHHAMTTAASVSPERLIVVVGHQGEAVAAAARTCRPDTVIAEQAEQKGTGHAVMMAADALAGFEGDLYVMFGDTPFLTPGTLAEMSRARQGAALVCLGFEARDPGLYGRLVLSDAGLEAIVEAKDATPAQLEITASNSGVMAGDAATMLRLLGQLDTGNAQGEYYLTDLVGLARAEGLTCRAVFCDEAETLGINDRVQLAEAEALFQSARRRQAMLDGATLTDPDSVFFSFDTRIARDVTIAPNVVFGPGVTIDEGAEIRAFCHIEGAAIGPGAQVGPFARLRPGTRLAERARIGNFVEIKKAEIGPGSKVSHLSYIGDAYLGTDVNIGAGTITCNYDGYNKHETHIGDRGFVGVNTALIAPVSVGEGAYIATGTVVSMDIPADALAVARTPQQNRAGVAKRLRDKLSAKAKG